MIGREILLGELQGRAAAALRLDGQLIDLRVDPGALTSFAPGALLRGKVNRLMKGQGGVFVTLPDGETGYLKERSGLRPGQPVLVQVTGVADDGKAIPLSTRLMIRGRYAIATPTGPGVNVSRTIRAEDRRARLAQVAEEALAGRACGLILRSAAEHADDDTIRTEVEELAALAIAIISDAEGEPELLLSAPNPQDLAWTDWAEPAADSVEDLGTGLTEAVWDSISELLQPRVDLPGGASAYLEPTRALLAVDVNTGPDSSPAAGLKANIALARELPRQLRLRGFGGQVVVDFAPMPKRERGILEQELKKAFRADGPETVLTGWTALGLFELTRKRDRVALSRVLQAE